MDIALVKTFLEIYQMQHFRKAADKPCITQSAEREHELENDPL